MDKPALVLRHSIAIVLFLLGWALAALATAGCTANVHMFGKYYADQTTPVSEVPVSDIVNSDLDDKGRPIKEGG